MSQEQLQPSGAIEKSIDLNSVPKYYEGRVLPVEILNNRLIIWLGSESNNSIPRFAYHLRNLIHFCDTAIDLAEHSSSVDASDNSIVLIISDEYATCQQVIRAMLILSEIKMIYSIVNESQWTPAIHSFRHEKLKYIFNDPLNVLRHLSNHKDQQWNGEDHVMTNDTYLESSYPLFNTKIDFRRTNIYA